MSAAKKFLFVSVDGMTDPLGQSQVLPYLTGLSQKGYDIEIASCEKESNFSNNRHLVEALISKHNIRWSYCFYKSKMPLLSQLKNYFGLKHIARKRVLANGSNVVLHCRSYLPAIIGLKLKSRYGTPFIFDMRGFWADERIDGNIWSKKNPITLFLYRRFKLREKQLLQQSDVIVSLTHKAKSMILSWKLGIGSDKIHVIPCCADLGHFSVQGIDAQKATAMASELPLLKNKFVLSYIGSLGTWYMIDEMMAFYRELLKKTDAAFVIVTKDDEQVVFEAARKAGVDPGSIVVRSAYRAEVPYYIYLSQASVFFIRPSFSKNASSPTKMGELLSMGVPIITNRGVGDVDAIVEAERCGVLVNDFDAASYTRTIDSLLAGIDAYRQHTVPTAQKYFSLHDGIQKYSVIYAAFLAGN